MLDIAVVGAGIMGANHARTVASSTNTTLAGVVDPDAQRRAVLGERYNVATYASVGELPDSVDAAVIATPTATHEDLAIALIDRGLHLLVEKPLAPTVAAARRIVRAAADAGVRLAVGHIERHNPAILQLSSLLDSVVHVDIARVSPFSARITDSVVLDLMIHDLDLVAALADGPIRTIQAIGRSVVSDSEDYVSALLEVDGGFTANVTASRIGQHKVRRIEITQRDSFVTVDLIRQDISVTRVAHAEFVSERGATYRQQALIEIPFIEARGEPLQLQLEDFVGAVNDDRPARVNGDDGVAAVELCQRVLDHLRADTV